MQNSEIGQENPKQQNGSRKIQGKYDLKIKKWKTGQEKQRKSMT